jgi:tRNA 2-thiouridine synthesizing protein C
LTVATEESRKLLVVVRQPPYHSSLARAALDTALAAAVFDRPVSLLFMGDGVLQLLPCQSSEAIGVRNVGRLLASLPLYEIDSVYADAESAARYGVDLVDTVVPAQALDPSAIRVLLADCDHLLGF